MPCQGQQVVEHTRIMLQGLDELVQGALSPRLRRASIPRALGEQQKQLLISCEHLPDRALDQGIVRTLWMSPDEVRASQARHRSPLVLRCIEDHLAGQRHPLDLIYTDAAVAALGPVRA